MEKEEENNTIYRLLLSYIANLYRRKLRKEKLNERKFSMWH